VEETRNEHVALTFDWRRTVVIFKVCRVEQKGVILAAFSIPLVTVFDEVLAVVIEGSDHAASCLEFPDGTGTMLTYLQVL